MGWTEEDWQAHLAKLKAPVSAPGVPKKYNKFGVSPKDERTVDGIVFASKAEAEAYVTLSLLKQSGNITKLELQPVYKFPPGWKYVADFRVTHASGETESIDVKGYITPVFRINKLCMEYFYPDVKLVLWLTR